MLTDVQERLARDVADSQLAARVEQAMRLLEGEDGFVFKSVKQVPMQGKRQQWSEEKQEDSYRNKHSMALKRCDS